MSYTTLKRPRNDENIPPQSVNFVQYVPKEPSEQPPKPKRQYRRTTVLTEEIRRKNQEAYDRAAPERARLAAEATAQAAKDVAAARLAMVKGALDAIKGAGFETLWAFFHALFTSKDQHVSAWISGLCRDHGVELHSFIHLRQPKSSNEWACKQLSGILESEGRRLAAVFKPPPGSSVTDILESFSMDGLLERAKEAAPMLFLSLSTLIGFEEDGEGRKHKDVVMGTIFAILAQCRNERASHFQTVLCVYLLACGATRSLFDVLNHAGLSLSYDAAIRKLKTLALENVDELRSIAHDKKFMIVWDNVNIAFRVGQQRTDSKDHFDNGTTATLLPVYGAARGEFPLANLPPRRTRKITFDYSVTDNLLPSTQAILEMEKVMLWHIQEILFDSYPDLRSQFKDLDLSPPSVNSIPLHTTKQYPLPAAFIDESTIDGTLDIISHILFETLGMSEKDLEDHGAILVHGDQLTISLIETASGSRRDDSTLTDNPSRFLKPQLGLFHTKMAGVRCTLNEHWGIANSKALWSLWRMSMLLGRKAISAGWNSKQATPFRPAMELMLDLVLPANILDGFRLHCGREDRDLDAWVKSIRSIHVIRTAARKVLENVCSARKVSQLRNLKPADRDIVHENILLFNRDALILLALRAAVKRGDIGTVVNVLGYWMLMFRGSGKMPKYADTLYSTLMQLKQMTVTDRRTFLFNWLVNLSGKPGRWKELDLLQEHQNFWLKVIYAARGANRSWKWMSIVSVCIFTLRDVIRQVQGNFKTPFNSMHHTSPSAAKDVQKLREYLQQHDIQTYHSNREGNEYATPARDLFAEGMAYTNTAAPFKTFRKSTTKVMYRKQMTTTSQALDEDSESDSDSELESGDDGDEVVADDLLDDEDEYPPGCDPSHIHSIVQDVVASFPDPDDVHV